MSSKFWTLFDQKLANPRDTETVLKIRRAKINGLKACNQTDSCHLKFTMNIRKGPFVYYADAPWSLAKPPEISDDIIDVNKRSIFDFALCERPAQHNVVSTNCSDNYLTCQDGTCVHDALVCDGHKHCFHGEDEASCKHVCNSKDKDMNCLTDCHYADHCRCHDSFFQCLSGGCIPLQKLCDLVNHCPDGSDEPATCFTYDQRILPKNLFSCLVLRP